MCLGCDIFTSMICPDWKLYSHLFKEPLNKSGRATMRIKIDKCETRNAVNIVNIGKFRNEAVGEFKLMDAGHDLFRGSLKQSLR